MKTYKVLVWHDYKVTDTYMVEVQAESIEDAMVLAEEEVQDGNGEIYSDHIRMDETFEASENNVTLVEEE
tara:strand:- start:1589 stop:1798 length:210 start_codon:yes stop_codon:yes gene_type:complete